MSRPPSSKLGHRTVLAIALPVMASNVSTPLIGAVDTAVVGRIPGAAYIGAVAVGSLVFTFVFWAFGFLRMGTTGLSAPAVGANDEDEAAAVLYRALLVAVVVGGSLIALQWPIREAAFGLLDGPFEVEALARDYFDIRIWAAPMTLANYAVLGWFIGLGRTRVALVLQLVLNVTNIALDAFFVLVLGWSVEGVALGTLLAETVAAATGILLARHAVRALGGRFVPARILLRARLRKLFDVSSDIMIRSLALIFVFVWFTAKGAEEGEVILAANAVLLHFVSMSAYFLDGLAFAAEALVGRAFGAGDREWFVRAFRLSTFWAAATASAIVVILVLLGGGLIEVFTVDSATREAARRFLPWAVGAPLVGVWAFQLDGAFIGATRTREMRKAMLVSLGVYLAAWWAFTPWGNHGLWAALYVSYIVRALSLAAYYPALERSVSE